MNSLLAGSLAVLYSIALGLSGAHGPWYWVVLIFGSVCIGICVSAISDLVRRY